MNRMNGKEIKSEIISDLITDDFFHKAFKKNNGQIIVYEDGFVEMDSENFLDFINKERIVIYESLEDYKVYLIFLEQYLDDFER